MPRAMSVQLAACLGVLLGCQSAVGEPSSRQAPVKSAAAPLASAPPSPPEPAGPPRDEDTSYRRPAAERIVAIGDLHGDLGATRRVLRLVGAIDAQDRWIGGKLVVVQTGDEIDRGDGDRAIVDLFDAIADAAKAAGGRVYAMVGNHEIMNASLDFRYVTEGGFKAFADIDPGKVPAAVIGRFETAERGRVAAFFPGGPYARRLAPRPPVLVVGDTVFVHGGVTADHVKYGIGRFNREVHRFLNGEGAPSPLQGDSEGPLWTRRYSSDESRVDCDGLRAALTALGAARMVVGHTPHTEGVTPACDGKVWRIDTGISSYYHGPTQALEIRGAVVTPLREAK